MALVGHSGMQTAQSMHSSGSMTKKFGPSLEAVDRTDVNAVGVFAENARFGDNVCHLIISPTCKFLRLSSLF